MRLVVGSLLAATLVATAPAARGQTPPEPRVIVHVADPTDCGGSGTSCPELDDDRLVSVGLDGSVEPFTGTPLHYPLTMAAPAWGLVPHAKAVQVRWRAPAGRSQRPMRIPLRGFGEDPSLSWSPGGDRFAVLEDFDDDPVDRLLVADPGHRRWWAIPRSARAREFWAVSWLSDTQLVAETLDRHYYLRLSVLDAASGRVVRSRYLDAGPWRQIAWSPAAQRLAVEDQRDYVGVVDLAHPNVVHDAAISGDPTWSPDGTGLFTVEHDVVQLAGWPAARRVKLPFLDSAIWLPTGHTLIALRRSCDDCADDPGQLLAIEPDGGMRLIRADWPPRLGPDDDLSLGAFSLPVSIEGLAPP
jgi:hypothetical protein